MLVSNMWRCFYIDSDVTSKSDEGKSGCLQHNRDSISERTEPYNDLTFVLEKFSAFGSLITALPAFLYKRKRKRKCLSCLAGEAFFDFMRRPRQGKQLLTQHPGRAAGRRKSRLLLDFNYNCPQK